MALTHVKELGTIPAGNNTVIKVGIVDRGKNEFVLDIRKWVDTEKYAGPTKQGIQLSFDAAVEISGEEYLDEFIKFVDESSK